MLSEISWEGYWTFIALTLVVYYTVLFVVFKVKTAMVKPGKEGVVWQQQTVPQSMPHTELPVAEEPPFSVDDFLYPAPESEEYPVYACVDEVNAYLEEARKHHIDKDELIRALAAIVAKYPSINETEYKDSLSGVMTAQSEHLCFIHLSAADMDRIWQG